MKILVYPSFNNPYQELLYNELKKNRNIKISFLDTGYYKNHYLLGLFTFPYRLIYYRLLGYSIFHLHWQHFEIPFFHKYISYVMSTLFSTIILWLIKIFGYKLVWTIHNLTPHERLYLDDLAITRLIINLSEKVIVHSEQTKNDIKRYNSNGNKIFVIPQGNYVDIYPNTIDQKEARNYFNLSESDFVLLFFGAIRSYKGLENLLESFTQLQDNKNLKLIIAGNCFDQEYKKNLIRRMNLLGNKILYKIQHIPDDQVQYYFNAADIAIFPFKTITNSSSVLLSSSFGKPVIVPELGGLKDLPKDIGYFYKNQNELTNQIQYAMSHRNKLKEKEKAASEYAHSVSWEKTASRTFQLYSDLI